MGPATNAESGDLLRQLCFTRRTLQSAERTDHNESGEVSLWGDTVLTILDVDVFDNYSLLNNPAEIIFAENIVDWIGSATVPIPAAAYLFDSGLGLLGWFRRKKA